MSEKKFDKYQKAAINAVNNSVVSAGAGSGKTTVLSERFLHLIQKENGCNVDEILTLTFTKKATVEMSDRIYKVLKEKAPDQAANFYKANIKTLDSYCNSVAKLGCHLYGISPDFIQDDVSIKSQLMEKALPFILEHRDNPALKEMISTSNYEEIANELFVEPILSNSFIAQPIDFDFLFQKQVEEIFNKWQETIKTVDDQLNSLVGLYNDCPGKRDGAFLTNLKNYIEDQEIPGPVSLTIDQIQNSECDEIAKYSKVISNISKVSQRGANGDAYRPLKDLLNSLKTSSSTLLSLVNFVYGYKITKELIPLLKEFQEIVNKIKRNSGILTFKDISNMALCILRDHPDIRKLEKSKYKAIMIDEFQDNNTMQRDMLFLLAEKPERMEKGIPEVKDLCPDKLFFVGDEKQSIYLFRGAEVEVFNALSKDFAEGNLEMTTNYRSHQSLIAAFNTIFGGYSYPPCEFTDKGEVKGPSVFYSQEDKIRLENEGQSIPNYEAVYRKVTLSEETQKETLLLKGKEKELKKLYEPNIHIALYDKDQNSVANKNDLIEEEAEAEWVSLKIQELIENGKDPSDIAILMRSYSLQPLYERTLLRHGIPYNTECVTGFYSDGPINDLMAFLRLIVYPEESNSYAQILRSPFTNLSIPESLAILSENKPAFEKLDKDILSGKSLEIYQKTGDFYRNLVNSAKFEPISTLISRLWYEIGYRYETLWNHTVEMYGKLYDLLFELARQADEENSGLPNFVDSIAEYKDESARLENMDIPLEQKNGVHILTIFKSKGLEYDTVFIIASHKGSKKDNNASPVFSSKDFGITINTPAYPDDSFTKAGQYFYDKVKALKLSKRSAELRRLTYVAITRAKKEVYITNGKYAKSKDASVYSPGGESNPDTIFKILEPIINYYTEDENSGDSPFDIENIPPLPRFADQDNPKIRKNTVSDKFILLNELEKNNLYQKAQDSGLVITKDQVKAKYTSPSKLHPSDQEDTNWTENKDNQKVLFAEINQIVRDSIPKAEFEKAKADKDYIPQPRFGFNDFGTIAHAYMEAELNKSPVDVPNKCWLGLDNKKEKIDLVDRICKQMAEGFKNSEIGKKAITSKEHHAEFAFKSRVVDRIIKGIIDLVFVNPDGTYTVLDYKTNQEEIPEIYYKQLACYRQAVSQMFNVEAKSINCVLFYLRSGHCIDITEECDKINLEEAVKEIS
ncbi:MAG: UvrD-helicase domain-containing protein [Treponema sp.]|nr:UvrD-helicase domain-containing protein [Treponema sp.]